MLDYLQEQKIFTHTNMKYTAQAQFTITHDYCNEFIDKCYSQVHKVLTKLLLMP